MVENNICLGANVIKMVHQYNLQFLRILLASLALAWVYLLTFCDSALILLKILVKCLRSSSGNNITES